ncbi:riboflavin synthase [Candidatus Micrarchaeota archaeon]|nr:riboflavin synthase [Candidatus Micrarchaeota archaeon]
MIKLGIVDTMFSRVNMGEIAIDEIRKYSDIEVIRRTVPGVKDLPVECKKLLENCDVCLALGMVGGAPIDTQCAHEASLGIQQTKLLTNKHIIEVFVHENEAWSAKEFVEICENRIRKHVHNAVLIVKNPEELVKNAGMGVRQGKEDEGPIEKDEIRIAIVVAQFNNEITERMEKKAVETAKGAVIKIVKVPGVYDMPLVVKKMLMEKKVHAVVALGAVVHGKTAHDEIITKDVAKRLGELSLEFNKPVTLGIIGHDVGWSAAEERAEGYAERATNAALDLVKTLRG